MSLQIFQSYSEDPLCDISVAAVNRELLASIFKGIACKTCVSPEPAYKGYNCCCNCFYVEWPGIKYTPDPAKYTFGQVYSANDAFIDPRPANIPINFPYSAPCQGPAGRPQDCYWLQSLYAGPVYSVRSGSGDSPGPVLGPAPYRRDTYYQSGGVLDAQLYYLQGPPGTLPDTDIVGTRIPLPLNTAMLTVGTLSGNVVFVYTRVGEEGTVAIPCTAATFNYYGMVSIIGYGGTFNTPPTLTIKGMPCGPLKPSVGNDGKFQTSNWSGELTWTSVDVGGLWLWVTRDVCPDHTGNPVILTGPIYNPTSLGQVQTTSCIPT